ncbi:hypothetical protein [Rubripirellula amarantea]|uniref:hypothetical protein n=1 Tax=Rubripirellula amarantea TaxID=2527999 RepID=UPI0011B59340|nr:hypothetical protein [Rubripirellula amarantea]
MQLFPAIAVLVTAAPVVALTVSFVLVLLAATLVYAVALTMIAWLLWCFRGIDTLVVYSDSPNWHGYVIP